MKLVCLYLLSQSAVSDSLQPHGHSLPGSSVHEILQARILEWVAISFSRGSFQSRNQTHVSCISCIGRKILYCCAIWVAQMKLIACKQEAGVLERLLCPGAPQSPAWFQY